ncbi:MAG: hypothetical protein IMW90_17940 [Thermogemmatispora sp.]|jgi:hypothetical protein|uniref:Uncharacterized protein n=1 Tax=Thermogemmatispora aurantia TaxID=2045279 RepID=A0A5J4K4R2_9CHLR|nr:MULTISPECIES: hypothetical protein [Thermogemmatispora]MBE3567600.1 hypothetical protein [Thermogemmatispora sp.]GER81717.1 hypothetical protein KTAU_03550 [Thermogemmatispora aurantia]
MAESEVARLLKQIETAYEAALRGLRGLACCARHDFINARMQHIGELGHKLSLYVGSEQAMTAVLEIHDRCVRRYLCHDGGGSGNDEPGDGGD